MTAGMIDLITIDHAREEEVDEHLYPQCLILCPDICKCRTHGADAKVATDTERGRKKPGYALPEAGDVRLGPTDTTQE